MRAEAVVALAVLTAGSALPRDDTPKWRWWPTCKAPHRTTLTIRLGGRVLYAAPLRLCHIPDSAHEPADKQRVAVFKFKADAGIFGGEHRHLGTRTIEGNVWEAGGDPSDIIIGISFDTRNQILLNTLHVANAETASHFELAPGLTSESTPFRPESPASGVSSQRRRTTR